MADLKASIFSKHSIKGMGKKKTTDLDKALSYFNLKGKPASIQATRLGIRINVNFKGKPTKLKPNDNPNSAYANKVREQVIQKWREANQEYWGTYKMFFKRYSDRYKKMEDVVIKITTRGTKDTILLNANKEFNRRREQYQEDYPENNSYELAEDPESLVPISSGDGIIVEGKRVESTTRGGQRTVGVKGNKRHMKMRDALSLKLKSSGERENEWDTGKGKCVFDYLIWKFKDVSGFKKKLGGDREKAEAYLNELFAEDDDDNPIEKGVSCVQLETFCEIFNINMYAYDKNDDFIQSHKCSKVINGGVKGRGVLCFIVFDNHFYPIESDEEIQSKVARATVDKPKTIYTSTDIETFAGDGKKKMRELIYPTKEEFERLKHLSAIRNDYLSIQNQFAFKWIKENGDSVPFPISSKNIKVQEATIDRMIFDDKVVMTKPPDEYIKRFYELEYRDTENQYQGEVLQDVMKYTWNNKYPFDIMNAPFLSQPNDQVRQVLSQSGVKWRTHLGMTTNKYSPEEIKTMLLEGKAKAFDICRCYCDALYNQQEPFIVFKGKEVMEKYDGRPLTLGLYFVMTDDMSLFHQSNWYSPAIIRLAKENGIRFTIVRQIRCVDEKWNWCKIKEDASGNEVKRWELSNDKLFKDWIDEVVEWTEQDEDFTLTKNVINCITGYLGKTDTSYKSVGLAKNTDELYYDLLVPELEANPNCEPYISVIQNHTDKMYLFGFEKREKKMSNGLPMYIQILDWSNMALFNLSKAVGGEVIYRKTDCIVSVGGKLPRQPKIKYYTDTFGKYRQEERAKALLFNYDLQMNMGRYLETPALDEDWIDYPFKSSEEWEGIIKMAIEKGGMLVSGRAGTGKSYIIGKGIEVGLLDEDPETRMSFTNRASRNIKGTTIHKNMAINADEKTNTKTLTHLKKHKVFVIDEISMINSSLWNKLMVLKKTTGAVFILLGDYRQCPPIEDGREIDYFVHPYAKHLANYNRCELTVPQRYDDKLWKWLEDFYEEGIEGEAIDKKKPSNVDILTRRNIVYLNKTRTSINNRCMEMVSKVKDRVLELKCSDKDRKANERAEDALIYEGLPVMAIANNKDFEIINSEEFQVVRFDDENIWVDAVDDDREEFAVSLGLFHKNFVVNYAATTHKSQGATYTQGINVWDWERMRDDRRIGYTAISRGKTTKQVWICDVE